MKNYLFVNDLTGEKFLVKAADKDEAFDIASTYFGVMQAMEVPVDELIHFKVWEG